MSPVEAGKKICPHIRAVNFGGWCRNNGDPANIHCIAEKCMAWHWHCKFENDTLEFSTTDGYCRLIHEGEV